MTSIALVLLISSLLSLVAAVPHNCGPPLAKLLQACAQPHLAQPAFCCEVLREFNRKQCWCQPPAMFAASQLATNPYAFSARVAYCNITKAMRPSIPTRDSPGLASTCPKFVSEPTELGANGLCSSPNYWREQRWKTLNTLDHLNLIDSNSNTVTQFKKLARALFMPNVAFGSIGLLMFRGREKTVDYLVSRQTAAGSKLPWNSDTEGASREGLLWAKANLVSYERTYFDGDSFLARHTFVTFAPCSAKIQELYIAENSVFNAIGTQFYYADQLDAYSQFNVRESQICHQIGDACGNKSPYKSKSECVSFLNALKKSGNTMCLNYNSAQLSPRAAVGDTVACRATTGLMAVSNADKYCPLLGKVAGGMCTPNMCADGDYGDLFKVDNPRYVGSGGFSCNSATGDCVELWP